MSIRTSFTRCQRAFMGGMILTASAANAAEPVVLYAAGSLEGALTEVASAFTERYGAAVDAEFAPSGLLRERIEGGLKKKDKGPDVFASANMAHPLALMEQGMGGPVVLFARNELCALSQPDIDIETGTVLDVLLDPDITLGTSTPGADPSGDYAWDLFRKAEELRPGSFETLDAKAMQLTGGPDSPEPAADRNQYAWVMDTRKPDVFLTYCTNGIAARKELPALQVIQLPPKLAVGASYGLTVLAPDNPAAVRLALFILSPEGQRILADFGFIAPLITNGHAEK